MTLHELMEHLQPTFPSSVQKDLKTAVRILAHTLHYKDPQTCPLDAFSYPLSELYRLVEAHLASHGKGPHTIRNVKNNLSRLFRLAEAKGLFSLLPAISMRRFPRRAYPNRTNHGSNNVHTRRDGSHLPRHLWPPALETAFSAFATWATDPLVEGREAHWKKRPITVWSYQQSFEGYFGYLNNILKITPIGFNQIFDFDLVQKYIHWHINIKHQRSTRKSYHFITHIKALANQYHPDEPFLERIKMLQKHIPRPQPFYKKNDVWLPLSEIERIGMALWPTKPPQLLTGNGRRHAAKAGLSLMLRLWVRIPYRSRNIREMKLGENLYQTPEGAWRIRFAEQELKVAVKQGQPNVFDLPFPTSLTTVLDDYLSVWRPIFAKSLNVQEIFLNTRGKPYTENFLRQTTSLKIYSYTGKRWHPHIIRTVWTTEYIRSTGDFYGAAAMLNDNLSTVIKNYAHLRHEDIAQKAYEWVQEHICT